MNSLQGKQLAAALGGRRILTGIDFELHQGEMLGIIGPNGAGKTTLLRLVAGLLPAGDGALSLDGEPLHELNSDSRARRIAYLPQGGLANWPISVERIIALGRLPHLGNWQRPGQRDHAIVERVMAQTGLLELRTRPVTSLSGGERARVLLARALAVEPQILLADEPVAALDPSHQLEVMDLLRSHCDQGGAVAVVLHDLRLAANYCDRLQLLLDGQTLAQGTPASVLTPTTLKQAYGIALRSGADSIASAFALTWERL